MAKKHRQLKPRSLRRNERIFINRACALRYSRQSTLKAIRQYRAKRGLSVRKQQVDRVYSRALKHKHVRKARKTNYLAMERKKYTPKGRRQRMQLMINLAEKARTLANLMEIPEAETP